MSERTVDTSAFEQAASALNAYIVDVQGNMYKMRDAAIDCSDNMGNDVYSRKAIDRVQDCVKELSDAISRANELIGRLRAKVTQIENSDVSF